MSAVPLAGRARPALADAQVRDRLVVLLAVNSGATDAMGLLGLGGAFTSVMTGNLVLTGVGLSSRDWSLALLTISAIAGFVIGCAVGARLVGPAASGVEVWPARVTRTLVVQAALTAIVTVGWWLCGSAPSEPFAWAMLVGNAVALGLQSSAVQGFGQSGLSTTYLTGTLTTLVIQLTSGVAPRAVSRSAALLAGLVLGAALGSVLLEQAPFLAPVLQLTCLLVVVGLAQLRFHHLRPPSPDPCVNTKREPA